MSRRLRATETLPIEMEKKSAWKKIGGVMFLFTKALSELKKIYNSSERKEIATRSGCEQIATCPIASSLKCKDVSQRAWIFPK